MTFFCKECRQTVQHEVIVPDLVFGCLGCGNQVMLETGVGRPMDLFDKAIQEEDD